MAVTKLIESNFEMISGNSKLLTTQVLDQDDAIVDISGAAISTEISKHPKSAALVTKAGVITDGPNGTFTTDLAPTDTDDLQGVYYYEQHLTDAGSRESTVVFGWATIKANAVD